MNIVENPSFRRYLHSMNPIIKLPSRRDLSQKLIPSFSQHVFENFVKPKLCSLGKITITFDLWMSRGCQDIFDIVAHGMDETFTQHIVHLRMIECSATSGTTLEEVLQAVLSSHNLTYCVIACVKDGGSNLKTCTNVLQDVVSCTPFDIGTCFVSPCFAHLLSGACYKAMSPMIDDEFAHIDSKAARACLQKCIIWTKKSGLGRDAWYSSCRALFKTERVMPTPVKTRFVSTVVMMSMMLKYRDVVEHCFSNQESVELQQRVPSTSTWEIVRVIVETMEPIMKACFRSQKGKGWILSDAVEKFSLLFLQYSELSISEPSPQNTESPFENDLRAYQRRMASVIIPVLREVIEPFFKFRDIGSKYVHHFLCLALDPEYKSLRNPFMRLHRSNPQAGRGLVMRYDSEVLIPLLRRVHNKRHGINEHSVVPENSQSHVESHHDSQVIGNITEEGRNDDLDCFIVNDIMRDSQRIYNQLVVDLSNYRQEPFQPGRTEKMQWLREARTKFPNVVTLAQHILGIPPTQIENERVFSLAGRIASPIRSNVCTA